MLEREGVYSKYLDYVAEENEKMRKLVIELLDYSKMEYQAEKSFRESVNISQCIEGISLEFEAKYVLKVLQENAETLSELFNSEEK